MSFYSNNGYKLAQLVEHRTGARITFTWIIPLFTAFQQQQLIPAIQVGIVSKVADVLSLLEAMNSQKAGGKGSKSLVKGRKKVVLAENDGQGEESCPVSRPVVGGSPSYEKSD